MKKCKVCDKDFEAKGKQVYCSDECVKLNKNQKRRKEIIISECLVCNTRFEQSRKDNVTCSTNCSQKLWALNNPVKNWERYNGTRAKDKQKIWVVKNQEKIKIIRNRYKQKKYTEDPLFKLKENVRNLIRASLISVGKKKNTKTETILGCTFEEFKLYIESLWEPWMNWDNKGNPKDGIFELNKTWDIDHIVPCSRAITEEDVIKLNHYSNYQPLCSYFNRFIKKNK